MSEVLLRTPDFELTIWSANGTIDARRNAYKTTLRRQLTAYPHRKTTVIYLSPPIDIEAIGKRSSSLPLDRCFFFENTEYHFEWLFYDVVEHGELTHRSRQICDSFVTIRATHLVRALMGLQNRCSLEFKLARSNDTS